MLKYIANFITTDNFDANVQVAKRAYDSKFALWVRGYFYDVSTPEDPNRMVLSWGTVGVFDNSTDANRELVKIKEAVKAR